MEKHNSAIIAGVLVLGVGALAYLSFRSSTVDFSPEVPTGGSTTTMAVDASNTPSLESKMVITAKHAYRKGEHIVVGEIQMPTPCHVLDVTPAVARDRMSATVHFTRSFTGSEPCAKTNEVSQRFRTNFSADQNATISATVDGKEATLNLIEARPDEDLDRFEIYIKG